MHRQNRGQMEKPKRSSRGILIWLGRIVAGLAVLILAGAVYETISEASDARAYPPPGQMVDVGGYRLHINCIGTGSPTVVIESGWGDSSAGWGWVQPEVAKSSRVCTYDRAGMGWSDVGPQPRTAREFAKELHTLLIKANVVVPIVLAGHSMGGFTVLVYAHDYSEEVAGLVLVDPQKLPSTTNANPQAVSRSSGDTIPALVARFGVMRLLAGPLGAIEDLPPGTKQAYTALSVAPKSVQSVIDEARGMPEGGAQAKAVTTLGDLPIIVLSRGLDKTPDDSASQARLLHLSSNSQQFFADKSGHSIQIDQPEAAIGAILKMVNIVRQAASR
jgi:pimeloyl-ACP methyl ester carboxylesterase